MKSDSFRFGRFTLQVDSRRLHCDGTVVDVSSRYFDALVLLVTNAGALVSKDRFMDDVWRGVPVTDEALTQCIRSLRRVLEDDATRPMFIETVPKHGYRFIAAVEGNAVSAPINSQATDTTTDWATFWALGGAGVVGGGLAGLLGGLFYGFAGASQPMASGSGAASIVLVLTAITILVALLGAAGVSFGIALVGLWKSARWSATMAGGAAGGFLVGGIVKLLGLDAFNLVLGQSPTQITGALEGAAIGASVGLGVWLGRRQMPDMPLRFAILPAASAGAIAGVGIVLAGGRLLGGSIYELARLLPQSRLRFDQIGGFFGETGFGPISQIVTGGLESMLLAAGITAAILLAQRQRGD
jgi:DNA-binding winged helix-turn-helix (wHTH) protein